MYVFYSFILLLGLLFYTPLYFFRRRVGRGEKLYLGQRFGLKLPPRNPGRPLIWIHAVSVGEVLSLKTLVPEIKSRHSSWLMYFSVLTPSGYAVAKKALPQADAIFLVPVDFYRVVRRFFRCLRPNLLILAESELWPNLLRAAAKAAAPVLVINGRISERSYRRYRRWRFLARRLLAGPSLFLVQSEIDRQRLLEIGVDSDSVRVTGNLKADVLISSSRRTEGHPRREDIAPPGPRKIIVAGSTHRGEEAVILKAYRMARSMREDLFLVMAPRHPDRAAEVEAAALAEGLTVRRRTGPATDVRPDVLILDTIGELSTLYALADVAFIGGSLVPHGGQNLLEPAFYGKPIFFGPHMENFASLAEEFLRCGAARVVKNAEELARVFRMEDEASLEEMGRRAREVLQTLRGATERTLIEIERFMGGIPERQR